jgi:hypothetical protein
MRLGHGVFSLGMRLGFGFGSTIASSNGDMVLLPKMKGAALADSAS